mgnify:CR=1 FL=1
MRQISLISSVRRTQGLRVGTPLHGRVYSGSSTLHAPAASESVQSRVASCFRPSCATRLAVFGYFPRQDIQTPEDADPSERNLSFSPNPRSAPLKIGTQDRLPSEGRSARSNKHEHTRRNVEGRVRKNENFAISDLFTRTRAWPCGWRWCPRGSWSRGTWSGKSADKVTTNNGE